MILALLLCLQAPTLTTTEVATFQGGSFELFGQDFGLRGFSGLVYQSGSSTKWIPATSPAIESWTTRRVLLNVNEAMPSGTVRVWNGTGLSATSAKVEIYSYDWFDIPPTPGTNPSPLAITVDQQERVWVNQEFHLDFQGLDIPTGIVTAYSPPRPVDPGPFASMIFSDHRTQTSILGEDVIVDPQGRIWFSQGGGSLYSGIHPNHSRIVCLLPDEPGGPEFRVYNIPNDWNEVIGLAWDPTRDWLWFAQGSLAVGSRICGFDPELIPYDNDFDFSTSLQHQVGEPGLESDPVFHYFDVPNLTAHAAHLLVTASGDIWFTHFWGSAIGRLQPFTGGITTYPTPPSVSRALPSYIVGPGPWQILEASNGDIIFNEFFDATITRFDITRADDPLAQALDINDRNPAMTDHMVPRWNNREETLHSMAYDAAGRLWYTLHTENAPGLNAAVGYLTADESQMIRFSPMDGTVGIGAWSAAGIAVDPTGGDLYFSEFWRKRIGRLQYVSPLP